MTRFPSPAQFHRKTAECSTVPQSLSTFAKARTFVPSQCTARGEEQRSLSRYGGRGASHRREASGSLRSLAKRNRAKFKGRALNRAGQARPCFRRWKVPPLPAQRECETPLLTSPKATPASERAPLSHPPQVPAAPSHLHHATGGVLSLNTCRPLLCFFSSHLISSHSPHLRGPRSIVAAIPSLPCKPHRDFPFDGAGHLSRHLSFPTAPRTSILTHRHGGPRLLSRLLHQQLQVQYSPRWQFSHHEQSSRNFCPICAIFILKHLTSIANTRTSISVHRRYTPENQF